MSLSQSHLPILERRYPEITGTVLAFDFGEKRIGVAVGETMLKVAHPLLTIDSETNERCFTQIANIVQEWRPSLLVVGLPLHMDGETHALTHLSKKFAQRLEGRFNLPVIMIDERLSSAEAAQNLTEAGIKGREQKAMLDAVAAQTILQSYFDGLSTS
ncbi:MAG: Holliday junction resolvase RuvX [Methylotenera sp.]